MRLAIAVTFLIALAALPNLARAEDDSLSAVAGLSTALAANLEPTPERKHEAHHPTKAVAKPKPKAKVSLDKGGAVPRFEQSFDPLSLTLAPETRIDPAATPYSPSHGGFIQADRGQVAGVPDPNDRITSAGIENMGKGNNHTVVVPLFQLLDKLSNQAPQRDQ